MKNKVLTNAMHASARAQTVQVGNVMASAPPGATPKETRKAVVSEDMGEEGANDDEEDSSSDTDEEVVPGNC